MRTVTAVFVASMLMASAAWAQIEVQIGYLKQVVPPPPVLSNLDPIPEDLGLAGARTGLQDNATTGRFLGHEYSLTEAIVPEGEDVLAAAREALADTSFLLIDAPAETILQIADLPDSEGALLFNVSAENTALRDEACRDNLFHTIPSSAMRTDALAQFLVQRRWTDTVLISGTYPADVAFAEALRRSLEKFQLRLRGEKEWAFDADMRRNAAQEVPLFTQDFPSHQILLVADETDDFGRYIAYNTWEPRPIAGSEGIVPVAWSRVVEQWGAAQLQSRFEEAAGRPMRSRDYAAWAAVRAIGEAVTRAQSGEPDTLRDFMVSDTFELAGFKGRPLTFRPWNGQLRQPIPLVTDRAVVANAPLEGFLHQTNELDTLGIDAPESACDAFAE